MCSGKISSPVGKMRHLILTNLAFWKRVSAKAIFKNLIRERTEFIGLSFGFHLAFLYTVIFIISAAILAVFAYFFITNFVQQQEHRIVETGVEEYRAWFVKGGLNAVEDHFEADRARDGDVWFLRILDSAGNVKLAKNIPPLQGLDGQGINNKRAVNSKFWFTIRTKDGESIWNIISVPLGKRLRLELGRNSTRKEELLSYIELTFLLKVLPMVLLGAIGGIVFTYHALRPIRRLVSTVRNILDSNKLSTRVPEEGKRGDLHDLVHTFNELLDRNETLILAMRDSLDSIAHELRTPMTRLRFSAEQALKHSGDLQACSEDIGECLEESDRLLTILHVLTEVSEAEAGAMKLQFEETVLDELVQKIIDLYDILAEEKHLSIVSNIADHLSVRVDRVRFQQALANLVDNAVKYSIEGTEILITADQDANQIIISVKDQGIGIPQKDLDRIWDRLYRAHRNDGHPGQGLGLSFVRAIVRAHGGEVKVESKVQEGSIFTIFLPKL